MDEIGTRVVELIAETGKLDRADVKPESSFEDLGIDSLDGANILFAIEDDFDIYIAYEPEQLKGFTVGDAIESVRKLVEEKAQANPDDVAGSS
jgi:acyl carrier protein